MRAELKGLLQETRTTTIYVTHDQVEAMSLADRIAVMWGGEIVQCDVPMQGLPGPADHLRRRLHRQPAHEFYRGRGGAGERPGGRRLGEGRVPLPETDRDRLRLGVRPEDLQVGL